MSRFLLPIGLLLLALIAYFAFFSESPSSVSKDNLSPDQARTSSDDAHGVSLTESGLETSATSDSSPCVSIEEFVAGPDGYRLDSWYVSWGAPPIGTTPDSASAYSWYDDKTLIEMGKAGDSIAKHERGRRLIIAGLTGVSNTPEESTIWDIAIDSPELPLLQNIDSRKLNTGREALFDAAVLGRTYALIEIAISYALERQAMVAAGEANSEELADLKIKSFAFGESVERLIPQLHSSFFQSSLPGELRRVADSEIDQISGRVLRERSELGVTPIQTDEETATLFDSLEICRDQGSTTVR